MSLLPAFPHGYSSWRVAALPMGTSCILPVGTGGPRLTFPTPFSVPSLCLRTSCHTRVFLLCPLPTFFNFFTSLPRNPCYSLDSCPLLHPAPVLPRATTLTHSCPEPLETFLQKSTTFPSLPSVILTLVHRWKLSCQLHLTRLESLPFYHQLLLPRRQSSQP